MIHAFQTALTESGRSRATVAKYTREAHALIRFLQGAAPSRTLLAAYREELASRHRPQTVNAKLSAVNATFASLAERIGRQRFLSVQRRAFIDEEKELTGRDTPAIAAAGARGNRRSAC